MDPTAFDRLTRIISASASRRGALAALLGALGMPLAQGMDAARRRQGKGKNRKRKNQDRSQRKKQRKQRRGQQAANAEATRCCATGNCTPGKGRNLQKCCYSGQDLTGKNFSGANLDAANFSGATLTNANLQGANAGKACLVDADLRGARITKATNLNGAIYCRTQTDSGENNSGCGRGTPCCPTCDADHPCGTGQVCCNGRCIPGNCCDNGEQSTCGDGSICCDHTCVQGECCANADCPNEMCQRRRCQDHQCTYTPISGDTGPGCQTVCCQDAQGDPVCCDDGVTGCQSSGVCGCGSGDDCGAGEVCCDQQCQGGVCCQSQDCTQQTCQNRDCDGFQCDYTPVFGTDGPDCDTLCCRNAAGEPTCCPDGTTRCQDPSGLCGCATSEDCANDEICCDQQCLRGACCETGDCAQQTCQQRACDDHQCAYIPISGETGPGCDGRICCQDAAGDPTCCPFGVTTCQPSGICGCRDGRDCGAGEVCCDQQCHAGFCCSEQNCGTRICEIRACVDFDCNYTPVFEESGPGCPTICCRGFLGEAVCCAEGVTNCQAGSGFCGCLSNGDCAGDALCCNGTCQSPTWTNQTTFGNSGSDRLNSPRGVDVTADGLTAWVAEAGNNRISVWIRPNAGSTAWAIQTTFGSGGSGSGQLSLPRTVSVTADTLTAVVADELNKRISVWTRPNAASITWTNQATFGSSGPNVFSDPRGAAVSRDGLTVWVADQAVSRVSVWTRPTASSAAWTHQLNIGSFGSGLGHFFNPSGVTVSDDGLTLWVTDQGLNRVSVWTRPNATSTAWTNVATFGDSSQFNDPLGVAVSADGLTAWVAVLRSNRVSIWTRPNATSTVWTNQATLGTTGAGPSQFNFPADAAVADDERTVWVADQNNNRISIWAFGCPAP